MRTPPHLNLSTPGVLEKIPPDIFNQFVRELNSGRHADIVQIAQKELTFEAVMACVAAKLDIALDGNYDVPKLCSVLLSALQRRAKGNIQPHEADPRLRTDVHIRETATEITLEEKIQEEKINVIKVDPAEGPYTICNQCKTSFDCCEARSCKLGSGTYQLGNTIATLDKTGLRRH